ncbi:hypothetical protein [Reinekea sp.]|jgi:hypothetical protein|uniref:hypothetical protein n=1 Tax=Reinekea sp. TaxID=1970455 RepID=UPI00398A3911
MTVCAEKIAELRIDAFSSDAVRARRLEKESRWWAYESKFLKAALVAMVFEKYPTKCPTPSERNAVAKRKWLQISEGVREQIKNEMARLAKVSYPVMGGV